jgi:hypothetical protein
MCECVHGSIGGREGWSTNHVDKAVSVVCWRCFTRRPKRTIKVARWIPRPDAQVIAVGSTVAHLMTRLKGLAHCHSATCA